MYYPKWVERLAKMDTEVARTARHAEYWYIMEIAGVFTNWDKKYYLWNLLYNAFLFSVLSYYVPCLLVSMFKVDDLAEMGQYLNFMSLIIISQSVMVVVNIKRESLLEMIKINAAGFYDYGDSVVPLKVKKLKQTISFLKKVLLVVLPTWMILIAGSVMVSDYVDAIFQFDTTVHNDFVNGVYQRLPLKMWYFHTIDTEYKRYIFILSQIICSSEMAMAITSADLILILSGQALIVQMLTLVIKIEETDERADKLYLKTHFQDPPKDPMLRKTDPELMSCYNICIKQLLEHHLVILRFFDAYQDVATWPAGVAVLNGAILVAMSIVSLMQGGGQPSLVVTSCLLVIAEVASLFFLCEIGQIITMLSEEAFEAMYQFEWMDCSEGILQNVMIMKSKMMTPLVMRALLTPLDRDAFSSMMNTAYTYMNLMRASEQNSHQK